ncbi:Protein roadkill [Hordeum vulgare]|nr:Protein roadkill [Hordeum vulgare]
MSSFAGVSVVEDGKLSFATASTVCTSADCGYHLLVVHGYSRTKKRGRTFNGTICYSFMLEGDSRTKKCEPRFYGIKSRPFMVGGRWWIVEYYPNGVDSDFANFISVDLHCVPDEANEEHVEAKFALSFVDEVEIQNPVYLAQREACNLSDATSSSSDRFIRRDNLELSGNLKDDSFTIRCDIMVSSCNPKDDAAATNVFQPQMCQHFEDLLHTGVDADVKFEVNGETVAAHRCVLAARSKVFMSQLFGPMKEGTTKPAVIQIKDMKAIAFRALLSFIYTDSFPEMEDGGMDEDGMSQGVEQGQEKETALAKDEMRLQWLQSLLAAADRYDVQRLKFFCGKRLSQEISMSSVVSTLALAQQHHCHGLEQACFKLCGRLGIFIRGGRVVHA